MKLTKKSALNSAGFGHVELLLIIVVVVVVVLVGGLVYQDTADRGYQNNVKPAYATQSAEMALAYKSFTLPVFSDNNSTNAGDAKNLAYINSIIKQSNADTTKLSSENHLFVVPGTKVIGGVNNTKKQYVAMKTYLADSSAFLSDYQTLSTYVSQLENLEQTKFSELVTAAPNVNTTTSLADLEKDVQTYSTNLNSIASSLKNLRPSPDLQKLNQEMIADLSSMSTDAQTFATAISSQNSQQLLLSSAKLVIDLNNLQTLTSQNVDTTLQTNSIIHSQIVKLESENPLGA